MRPDGRPHFGKEKGNDILVRARGASPAPSRRRRYTIFGKVVQGLDVVRTIYSQPVLVDDRERDGARRPVKPVVIQKVEIHRATGP
jgi:cyclophilin family peptidyl-prolyl cis-trans isomerase